MAHEKTWDKELAKLERMETEARLGGGKGRLDEQRASGKMTARERVEYLLDPGSFAELNMLAEHQCRDFGMESKKFLGAALDRSRNYRQTQGVRLCRRCHSPRGINRQDSWSQDPLCLATGPGV
jgi:hypothetical protein